jgi:hypothetical protein
MLTYLLIPLFIVIFFASKQFKNNSAHGGGAMIDLNHGRSRWVLFLFLILSACSSTRHLTYSEKSSLQQLLVSKAIDEALQGAALDIEGSKIFVEVASLTRKEDAYFKKAISQWLLKKKALLTLRKEKPIPLSRFW